MSRLELEVRTHQEGGCPPGQVGSRTRLGPRDPHKPNGSVALPGRGQATLQPAPTFSAFSLSPYVAEGVGPIPGPPGTTGLWEGTLMTVIST